MVETFHYRVTIEDLITFNLHFSRHSPTMLSNIRNSQLSLSLVIAVVSYFLSGFQPGDGIPSIIIAAIAGVIVFVGYRPLFWMLMKRALSRQLRETSAASKSPGNIGDHTLTVSDEGLVEATATNESRYRWAAVDRVDCTPTHVFIFVGATIALVVPFAPADADRQRLLDALRGHVSADSCRVYATADNVTR